MAITKAEAMHRVGSFGTPMRHGENGCVTEIWFCGAMRERNGHMQDRCAHRSKREAQQCVRDARRKSAGEG